MRGHGLCGHASGKQPPGAAQCRLQPADQPCEVARACHVTHVLEVGDEPGGAASHLRSSRSPHVVHSVSARPASQAPNHTLSLTRGCAAQTTITAKDAFSCPITASGGLPGYSWTVSINGTSVLADAALPTGLITTTPNGAATETYAGNPTQVGTYTSLVTVMDSEPGIPRLRHRLPSPSLSTRIRR